MKVLYFGTYSLGEGYPRNSVIIQGLRENGVEVIECHEDLWRGSKDKIKRAGTILGLLVILPRLLRIYISLIYKFAKSPDYDLIVVGYTGQIDIFLVRILNLFKRKPVVLDAFISIYDTIVMDRSIVRPGSIRATLLWWLDRTACRVADLILLDTSEHINYFVKEFGLPREKFCRVFVGGDEVAHSAGIRNKELRIRRQKTKGKRQEDGTFNVLYFGTYIPLHGVEYIIKAAKHLEDEEDICFTLVGTGQLLEETKRLASDLSCKNIEFIDRWIPSKDLAICISKSDICLGIFGTTGKASQVIPCKVYDCMAFGKAIITADTPAIKELLQDGKTAILVDAGNPKVIAESILKLKSDKHLRLDIGKRALEEYKERCLPKTIGRDLIVNINSALTTVKSD
jgi:glycosyltransferase involved in cell wall biosynthesis